MSAESKHGHGDFLRGAAEKFHDQLDLHHKLDDLFMRSANEVGGVNFDSIFNPVSDEFLRQNPRPDSINHNLTYLSSNPYSAAETEQALGLMSFLHGEHEAANAAAFAEFTKQENFFERLKEGQTFILVGSHIEFQDVGFNLGYLTRAAHEAGIDRFDSHVTLMIGRMLGYLEVMGLNVIDDILRKAANIQKSFPVSGGEAINEGDITDEDLTARLKRFRSKENARAREKFMQLVHSSSGHVIIEAGSGSRDAIDENGHTVMEPFAKGTREDLHKAARAGAIIYPVFCDYGDATEPSVLRFGPAIDHLDSPEDAHKIGEVIATIGNHARGHAEHEHPEVARFKSPIRYGSH